MVPSSPHIYMTQPSRPVQKSNRFVPATRRPLHRKLISIPFRKRPSRKSQLSLIAAAVVGAVGATMAEAEAEARAPARPSR